MITGTQRELEKIEEKKKKLQLKEKIIKEKDRRKQKAIFSEIGAIANKAGIDTLDPEILLGAFIDISEKLHDESNILKWKENIKKIASVFDKDQQSPIIIKFQSEITQNEKDLMKKLNFKWNKFRSEFYGYGIKNTLEKLLKDTSCKIELVE